MPNLTISMDEQLIKAARVQAIQQGTSLSAKIREFVAQYVASAGKPPELVKPVPAVKLRVYSGGANGGMMPGIDPCSNKSMLDAADGFLDSSR
jgi:plasmid stability protein